MLVLAVLYIQLYFTNLAVTDKRVEKKLTK